MWDELRDLWEYDSHFRMMIWAGLITGAIGLGFAITEVLTVRKLG